VTARHNKFNAVRVEHEGMTFDSKKEFARYMELLLLQKAKLITDLVVHPSYVLRAGDSEICRYIADFTYYQKGKWIVEDVKSEATARLPAFRIKLKLFHANFPNAEFRIIGAKAKSMRRKVRP
jgi:Protein of unknown function (DUF1064)